MIRKASTPTVMTADNKTSISSISEPGVRRYVLSFFARDGLLMYSMIF